LWGLYRNSASGAVFAPAKEPMAFGQDRFKKGTKGHLQKIASGCHHSLALTADGKVYGWGDPECGKIGRMLVSRNKNKHALFMEGVGAKKAVDIFCGGHSSFYVNDKGQGFAWGMNNHGQLGIGNTDMTCTPTKILMDGTKLSQIKGGEHHTIGLTSEGKVYCWGRNDESQCG
jgi:alpha-tubulin suppressor-like RCC1 family protein